MHAGWQTDFQISAHPRLKLKVHDHAHQVDVMQTVKESSLTAGEQEIQLLVWYT